MKIVLRIYRYLKSQLIFVIFNVDSTEKRKVFLVLIVCIFWIFKLNTVKFKILTLFFLECPSPVSLNLKTFLLLVKYYFLKFTKNLFVINIYTYENVAVQKKNNYNVGLILIKGLHHVFFVYLFFFILISWYSWCRIYIFIKNPIHLFK